MDIEIVNSKKETRILEEGAIINNFKIININSLKDKKGKYITSLCECISCGNLQDIYKSNLKYSNAQYFKCDGCRSIYIQSLIGKRFGKLLVISYDGQSKNNRDTYICRCDCGNSPDIMVNLRGLEDGYSTSCRCLDYKYNTTLNIKTRGSRLYRIYGHMKNRCYNVNNKNYDSYGGRGIYICDKWLDDENGFIDFYKWAMDNGYSDDLSIDRIDNDGPYVSWNCRWSTYKEQNNNRRSNRYEYINGIKYSLHELANTFNIPYDTVKGKDSILLTNLILSKLTKPIVYKNPVYYIK